MTGISTVSILERGNIHQKSQFWKEAIYTKSLSFGGRQYTPKVSILGGGNKLHQKSQFWGEAIYIKSQIWGRQ